MLYASRFQRKRLDQGGARNCPAFMARSHYLIKLDPNLDDFCARPDVVEAFVALVVKSFVPKEVDVKIPKCVVESREEWTGEDNFDAKIGELFERGGSEDVLTPREIGEHAQEYCEDAKDFNKNLIGRTLRALGYILDRKKNQIY